MNEQTETGEAPKVETEAIYAWALDDGDDLPTQRLTSRRITSLGIAASLVVIAVAGAVAFTVLRQHGQPQAAPVHVVETVAPSTRTVPSAPPAPPPPPAPVPTITVTAAPPPAPIPTRTNSPSTETAFVSAVFDHMPTAWIPGGRPSDVQLLASGYEACRVMGQYGYSQRATTVFYQEQGFNLSAPGGDEWPGAFMSYATMLCNPEG